MSLLLSVLGFGLLLGIRHATDADHVVAVTTIVSRQKKIHSATIIGILWGIGHSVTVTLIAIPIIAYSFVVPPKVGLGLEFAVGVMLVFLGFINLSGITEKFTKQLTPTIHNHKHIHEEYKEHSHMHAHIFSAFQENMHHIGLFQTVRPLFIGFVHGLAGSTAITLLILSTIHNHALAVIYLFIFHIGVIIGMMLITTLLGVSITVVRKKSHSIHKYLIIVSGLFSIGFGLYLMYQTGVVDWLFLEKINWKPI